MSSHDLEGRADTAGTSPSPYIIPLFISHQGCPNRCVFCNQWNITGKSEGDVLGGKEVRSRIEEALARPRRPGREVQVAFYGGSFTGIPKHRQLELLDAVAPFKQQGKVHQIRLSTRPDYIDENRVSSLCEHGVDIVELGIQSLDQKVLDLCRRGHTVGQVTRAFSLLRKAGLIIGGQLMIGLPGETTSNLLRSAKALCRLQPHFVRIYPVLVIKETELEIMWQRGEYKPLSIERAVALAARVKELFNSSRIPVIRMGLQPTDCLERMIASGPYHPAFGELVLSRILFRKVRMLLTRGDGKRLILSSADESVFRGKKNRNVKRLQGLGLLDGVEMEFRVDAARGEVILN